MFLLIAWVLWRWEPKRFVDFIVFRTFQKANYITKKVDMIVFQKCLTVVGLTGLMSFVCSGAIIEKFAS